MEGGLRADATASTVRAVATAAGLGLVVELLQAVLKLGKVLDLILEHHDGVLTSCATPMATVLELAHLVHAADDLLLIGRAHRSLSLLLGLVHDLDSRHVGVVARVVLEIHLVLKEEVHEAALLLRRQLAEDEGLGLWRAHRLRAVHRGAAPRLAQLASGVCTRGEIALGGPHALLLKHRHAMLVCSHLPVRTLAVAH